MSWFSSVVVNRKRGIIIQLLSHKLWLIFRASLFYPFIDVECARDWSDLCLNDGLCYRRIYFGKDRPIVLWCKFVDYCLIQQWIIILMCLKMHLWISWSILRILQLCSSDFIWCRFEFVLGMAPRLGFICDVHYCNHNGNFDLLLLVVSIKFVIGMPKRFELRDFSTFPEWKTIF